MSKDSKVASFVQWLDLYAEASRVEGMVEVRLQYDNNKALIEKLVYIKDKASEAKSRLIDLFMEKA